MLSRSMERGKVGNRAGAHDRNSSGALQLNQILRSRIGGYVDYRYAREMADRTLKLACFDQSQNLD